jgi:hypothetical protein
MVGYLRQFADTAIPAESVSLLDELDFGPFDSPIVGRKSESIAAQPLPKQRQ